MQKNFGWWAIAIFGISFLVRANGGGGLFLDLLSLVGLGFGIAWLVLTIKHLRR